MKLKQLIFAMILSSLTACSANPSLLKSTQSGMAEGTFVEASLVEVKNMLIKSCTQRGRLIREASDHLVICSKQLNGAENILAHALIGNSYSTPPESVAQFTLYQSGRDVNVVGSMWLETKMALGQVRKVPLDSPKHVNTIQQALFDLGAY
ncbi:hypothetical protein MO867_21045 [Microbulbifer sp. OS29]|uniref:Lipoprotein n=1 Tax=Microbulbifer okhotskensis TaxID=2926617 RepID=A0A9X2EVQ1_9GAMM|nr:hypothetical protein [Microbulbifer okhotskensis]MCO1336818.1 hypothetical protein [Microbulbifer okhotskensis]